MQVSVPQEIGPQFTRHATARLVQRGIKLADVEFTMRHGKKIYKQGLVFYVMIDKIARLRGESVRHLVVLASHEGNVVTVYKEKNALKKIKRASKIDQSLQLQEQVS
ncbi:hypothetical protein COW36_05910 [bacterium (Candidatus Blackallbacteria) CG17_big_fil_post_rev_8_21_14_2_50_48_46]|uniref:DUF4258 domain-containing protein n=1 Tax=bacterium (Candidatus Blackallbacteria) CG17_big_fil_post_rev_8_21_14_2_50_48_46 TaxID=2014261 RepID=A0A2M7G8Z6_9BACT|nr:MAG: hypothetical protein COW64_21505 [bacterium (Candidatus Blackallbacteria) CG18_big_fil_WC_8_21_14_2_50_49_26]PIW18301.1 MAG: hypothetical protein COW36_05910 [bacterium (Candidatus Blackallbacteria) CG17_big_fil_post_rev_8_21_14_2_50_48_46]PIW49525.1 MAG: hypothetical protein COW20_05725 [bacterium (Candidatus Blackallbacteria) CG13_big_fil_rev_8_21_14_2_50_49_14]